MAEVRLKTLMAAISKVIPRQELATRAGCAPDLFSRGYADLPTMRKIGEAAAALAAERGLGELLPADPLIAWLSSEPAPGIDQAIGKLRLLACCSLCRRCFARKKMINLRCKQCYRNHYRDAKSPGGTRFRRALVATLGALRTDDPEAARAVEHASGVTADLPVLEIVAQRDPVLGGALVEVLRADPAAAITGPQVSRASRGKIPAGEVSSRIEAAVGLRKRALVPAAVARTLVSSRAAREAKARRRRPAGHTARRPAAPRGAGPAAKEVI